MSASAGRSRTRPLLLRAAAAAAAAAIAVPAAACGGGPAAAAGSSSSAPGTHQQFLAYSQCMREHGDPGFPDPVKGPGGAWAYLKDPQTRQAFSGPGFNEAKSACKKLQPPSGITPAARRAALQQLLKIARCMRAHGITNFPDPTTAGGGVEVNLGGIDPNTPQFRAAQQACHMFHS